MKLFFEILAEIIKALPALLIERMDETTRQLQAKAMIGRRFWYVTDFWETFCIIPVLVVDRNSKGELMTVWELGDGLTHSYNNIDPAELYRKRADAEKEARRRNKYNRMERVRE